MILNQKSSVVTSRIAPGNTPIQQIKTAGVTARTQSSQGLPQPVSGVRVAITKTGTGRILRVSFTQNPQDPYFTGGQLYVSQGNLTPTLVASGTSPIVVTMTKSNIPVILKVVSSGNWGSTGHLASPGKVVSLA